MWVILLGEVSKIPYLTTCELLDQVQKNVANKKWGDDINGM